MKPMLLLWVWACSTYALPFDPPQINLYFLNTIPTVVFYGETLRIPLQMDYSNLKQYKLWQFPAGSTLETVSGICPFFADDLNTYPLGSCQLNLAISGLRLGNIIAGNVSFNVHGRERNGNEEHYWNYTFTTAGFSIEVIPHYLTSRTIPIHEASVQLPFKYFLKNAVDFYDQNADAGKPAAITVEPSAQNGMAFNPTSLAIEGQPEQTGTYNFTISAQNSLAMTTPTQLQIQVNAYSKTKPVFLDHYHPPSAAPTQPYSWNLLELLSLKAADTMSNQISFRLDANATNPAWLQINPIDGIHLQGTAPKHLDGQELLVHLVASSNTGGDTQSVTVKIPIAQDPSLRPFIEYFKSIQEVGNSFRVDVTPHVEDPAHDGSLRLLLDRVEPAAPWLSVSAEYPPSLVGKVPPEAAGKTYLLRLRVNNLPGGSSYPIIAHLKILPHTK